MTKIILLLFILILNNANAQQVKSHQSKLSNLNHKIIRLDKNQRLAKQEKKSLTDDLKSVALNISKISKQIENISLSINIKQTNINQLQTKLKPLKDRFDKHQLLLSKYLTLYYQLGKIEPLTLVLNQKDPTLTTRLMTYISYINKSRANFLKEVDKLSITIKEQKHLEQKQVSKLQLLLEQQLKSKQLLKEDEILQKEIIKNIAYQIKDRSKRLKQLNKNKSQLHNIIAKIKRQQQINSDKIYFASLKEKLPWPTAGKIQTNNNTTELPFNGIYIQAHEGRQVNAVSTGKVVFADWLRGYGLLIIIQHDHGFMTLYANNQALYKDKGEKVYSGDKIATVGHSGGQLDDGLYFELRHNGKPLNPLAWLKKYRKI